MKEHYIKCHSEQELRDKNIDIKALKHKKPIKVIEGYHEAQEKMIVDKWKISPSDVMPVHIKAKYRELKYKLPVLDLLLNEMTH